MADRLDLGVGLVLLPGYEAVWDQLTDLVDVIEIEPATAWWQRAEGEWLVDPEQFAWWSSLRQPKLCHGVGFPVGGSVAPHPAAVELFAQCAGALDARLTSEHLSFNRTGGPGGHGAPHEAGFLLPPHQSLATVAHAVAHVQAYQQRVGVPFAIETGVSYLQPRPDELRDGQFVAAIAEQADCGILLDLHNVWANERNGRQTVASLLEELPLERIQEVHLAGGFELDGCWLDAHSGLVPEEVLALAAIVLPRLPNVRAVVFEMLPAFLPSVGLVACRRQLEQLHRLVDEAARVGVRPRRPLGGEGPPPARSIGATTPADAAASVAWERALLAHTTRAAAAGPGADPGISVLRHLTDHARLGRVTAALPGTLHLLFTRFGVERTDTLLATYLAMMPAHVWVSAEAEGFAAWLEANLPLDATTREELAAELTALTPPPALTVAVPTA